MAWDDEASITCRKQQLIAQVAQTIRNHLLLARKMLPFSSS